MICVTGATGTIGSALVARLGERGAQVRAVGHSPAGQAQLAGTQVEVVEGDFDAPETLAAAMAGCDHVFLLSPPHPDQPTREVAALDAARAAGVSHVVALSIMGADRSSPVTLARSHAEIDEHLVGSGLGYTILRPAGFMQTHLWPVATVRTQGRWYGMTGDGAAGFIDAEDIAAVAAEVLTNPGHEGTICELTGPAAISMPQAAATLTDIVGRPVTYVDVSAEEFAAQLVGAGLPDSVIADLVVQYSAIRAGHAATVTNWVEQITGRPARSYREFAQVHADDFAA